MSDIQWIWMDQVPDYDNKPNMYYDSQQALNYQQALAQSSQTTSSPAPAYKYINTGGMSTSGGDMALTIPPAPLSPMYKEVPRWSWCSVGCSLFSMICCCTHIFGLLGLLCSVFSYVDHKAGDYDRSSYKRKCSWVCTVLGIVLALFGALAVILVFVVFPNELRETLLKVNYNADPLKDWQENSAN